MTAFFIATKLRLTMSHNDTIVAQATPPGRGGVGILRISGLKARDVAQEVLASCRSRAMPTTCRLKTLTAARWIRVLRCGSPAQTPSPVKMCWSYKGTAVR